MLRMLAVLICVFVIFAMATSAWADLFDNFSGDQTGSWAPARWWDDYACRGRFVVPGKCSPKLDVAFSVTLNNEKHTYVDKDKSPYASDKEKMESLYGEGSYHVVVVPGYQPKNIDTMAIYFANQRPFELITFAKVEQ